MLLKTLPALNSDSLLKQGLCVEQALKKTFTRHIKFKGRQMVHEAKTILIGYLAWVSGLPKGLGERRF